VNDVEAVITDPEFYSLGRYYFAGVWGQAGRGAKGQQDVLRVLASDVQGCTLEELVTATRLSEEAVDAALDTLLRHDVIVAEGTRFCCAVELMRRWVVAEKVTRRS
jgi:hypothetical protein